MPDQVFDSSSPLYAQIRELIVGRIHSGEWQPGALIPGDTQFAQEYKVSQGTVRKAIDSLVDDQLVIRRQGKGSFLASHNSQKELFHFFHLIDDKGERALPTSKVRSVAKIKPTASVNQALGLGRTEQVICIKRLRMLNNRPAILETIYISARRFKLLTKRPIDEIPNALYEMYEKEFGVMIRRAKEILDATSANKKQAGLLGVKDQSPLLRIKRIAYDLEGVAVEYRESYCDSTRYRYLSNLL